MTITHSSAWVLESFGPEEKFLSSEIPVPKLAANQLLIKVAASSVNPIDIKIHHGLVPGISPAFPATLHGDVAGTVVNLGDGVADFKEGDEIFGCAGGVKGRMGATSEYMVVDREFIAKRPRSIPLNDCAALPLVSLTAWIGLFLKAQIKASDQVLVFGGTGGVGHVAAQLAKAHGSDVSVTVGSEEKAQRVKDLGFDEAILYKEESAADFKQRITQGLGFDCVFDTVGQQNLDLAFELAKTNGKVINIAARSQHDLTPLHLKGLSLFIVFMLLPLLGQASNIQYSSILSEVADRVDSGQLKPLIHSKRFKMADISLAYEELEQQRAIGKILLEW